VSDQPTDPQNEVTPESEESELQSRRLFLQGVGKWSGAAIMAALVGLSTTDASAGGPLAGGWLNRRGGGGWINGGGGWINRGGSWLNGRGGGGGWVNRRGGGGGGWINRR
jgi:hypothetical protein